MNVEKEVANEFVENMATGHLQRPDFLQLVNLFRPQVTDIRPSKEVVIVERHEIVGTEGRVFYWETRLASVAISVMLTFRMSTYHREDTSGVHLLLCTAKQQQKHVCLCAAPEELA